MIPMSLALALLLAAPSADAPPASRPAANPIEERRMRLPFVGEATVYIPPDPTGRAILFLSGDDGWGRGVVDMARRAASNGPAAVAGLSYPALRKAAQQSKSGCWYPAGDLETIGQSLEKQLSFSEYSKPTLVGYSSGATIVYAALAASGESFSGGMSLGFCPELQGVSPLCAHDDFRPTYDERRRKADFAPVEEIAGGWEILQGEADKACTPESTHAFARDIRGAHVTLLEGVGHGYGNPARWGAAFDQGLREIGKTAEADVPPSSKGRPGALDPDLEAELDALGLPLVTSLVGKPRAFLLFISGDGGWSSLDKALVEELAQHGVSTVAINTLKYFWSEKSPDRVAADLKRLVEVCRRGGLPLFAGGYSFGAEVMPVVLDRAEFRKVFAGLVLISPGPHASFEVSVLDWLRTKEKSTPYSVLEHTRALQDLHVFFSAGQKDEESICPELRGPAGRVVELLPGSHHYNGSYHRLAASVWKFLEGLVARSGASGKP